jgi:hypothetical protein
MFELLNKSRRDAMHLMRPVTRDTPMFGKTVMFEVACGQPLDGAALRTRTTMAAHLVTCRQCHAIAHPPKSPYDAPSTRID